MAIKVHIRRYTNRQVDDAGKVLLGGLKTFRFDDERGSALEILSNFRACHNYPINTFQATIRDKVKKLKINSIVSQRLKRAPSIVFKLQRFKGTKLSHIQDIGGVRAIVPTIKELYSLVQGYEDSNFQHERKSK